ncbi:hypothetical protein GQ53DRAFT_747530 [Thozetella sp. PMI_491]|nr:hypothetical protein GQ53DRAFT_747530 [Thozetella sp. PMI_491]
MAGVADKARFYLERAVPQLREFEEKEIFSKDEIRTLVSKRSNFEHLVLAPRSSPDDYLAYAQWEQSLEALRAKRCRRLKIHSSSSHAGQGRTFKIYERAVNRHPGNVQLWLEYLAFAAKVKATKRWRKVATQALRMHPRDVGLWTLAGTRAAQNGDMAGAREYFMRGCRFCTNDASLWIEYAKCEMEWLRRIEAKKGREMKKGVTALQAIRAEEAAVQEGDMIALDEDSDEDDEDGPSLLLPDPEGDKAKKNKQKLFDEEAEKKLENSPALSGAIPMAIFDISKKQPFYGPEAAESFFELFGQSTGVSSHGKIVQHVLSSMEEQFPHHPSTCNCVVKAPIVGVDPHTAAFPKGLRESLALLSSNLEKTSDREALVAKTIAWIDPVLAIEDLDEGIRTVLEHTKRKLQN